ncbi:MAG: hypothetical protein VYE64_05605 [Planctomycetota bacterium]|nr:hypothetical protein [Planctomycetota bacterium]
MIRWFLERIGIIKRGHPPEELARRLGTSLEEIEECELVYHEFSIAKRSGKGRRKINASEAVQKRTNMLDLYSQIVTAVGFLVIVVGALLLVWSLIQELGGEDGGFQIMEVVTSAGTMLWGVALTAFGSAMAALRTIAVNCARIAEKE